MMVDGDDTLGVSHYPQSVKNPHWFRERPAIEAKRTSPQLQNITKMYPNQILNEIPKSDTKQHPAVTRIESTDSSHSIQVKAIRSEAQKRGAEASESEPSLRVNPGGPC